MTFRDFYILCFAAAAVIHGTQTVLAAKLGRPLAECDRVEAMDTVWLGVIAFLWQFGNFVTAVASADNITPGPTVVFYPRIFEIGNILRDGSLVCFPLIFSYRCLHMPEEVFRRGRRLLALGRHLRYPLWPWTGVALVIMVLGDAGFQVFIIQPNLVAQITLYVMLLYFVIFTVTLTLHYQDPHASGVSAFVRARKATIISGILAVAAFVLMLSGYAHAPIPFLRFIELAAMLMSVPFVIAIAYRLSQLPFMDAFVREVLSGVILLASVIAAWSVSPSVLWITACAILLAYAKGPLSRWVERVFLGYQESVDEEEERIGNGIRALTRLDEFGARVSEILISELEAEWVEITSESRFDAVQRFEIPGSGLWLSLGPRIGGRQYMSRQLRIARTAALQLSAHHHQLNQHELRELTARAQMRALKAQINPHFLFNTLNVLANLIHTNPGKAERVTEELADIFRYALESTRVDWVQLDDELRFLESYLEIEKARFEARLAYSFDIDPAVRAMKLPPMILQPLVENAVKHGIGPKVEGGEVRVSARLETDCIVIVVEDTGLGHKFESRHRGSGVGLTNVRERLQHLYGNGGTLVLESTASGGTRAVVRLPQLVGVPS